MQKKEDAKTAALAIVSVQTGTTEIKDITEGWVAFIDGDLKAYSVKVTVDGESYIVTDQNVIYDNTTVTSTNAVANKGTEVALVSDSINEQIVSYKVDTYVKDALTKVTVSDEEAYTVAEMSSVTTNPADSGWIHFKKENSTLTVYDYSLTYGSLTANYSSLTDGVYVSTFGSVRSKPVLLAGTIRADGAKYLTIAQEVWYNPTKGTTGGTCESTEEGCMHWYLYSVKGDYANMLLDHNITDAQSDAGVWASSSDYSAGLTAKDGGGYQIGEGTGSKATSAGITYPNTVTSFRGYDGRCNSRGPVTALNTLKSLTSAWKTGTPKVPNSTSTNEHIIPSSKNDNRYQIDYTGYHARLITKEEAEYIGCTGSNNSCPEWMIKATIGENSTTYANIEGYWTSSPTGSDGERAIHVWYLARTINSFVSNKYLGIRPVITVLASDVL